MLSTLALLAIGVVMVHSAVASVAEPGAWYARVDFRHTLFAAVAALVLLSTWRLGYRWLNAGAALPIPAAVLLGLALLTGVLAFVPGVGHSVGGRWRWIRLGPVGYSIGFQPSELIRVSLVIFLAAWLSRPGRDLRSFTRTFLPAAGLMLIAIGVVVTQDFGSGMLIGLAAMGVMFLAGVPLRFLALLVAGGAAGFYKFVILDAHRWGRIEALLNPWDTANPASYQPRNSLLAIANGGWFGRGLGNGVRKLGYLPEDTTDFIFSVFVEEWGFVGAVLLGGLVLTWIYCARRASRSAPEPFGGLLIASLAWLIALQAVMHIAVDVVALPPTGMSFPFVSAGGTALVVMSAATALMVSASCYRPAGARSAAGDLPARPAPA